MKLPEWLKTQIKKKFWERLSWISFVSIIALLGDEYIKEGYILNLSDVTNPLAHEFWIVIFSIVCLVSTYISEKREAKNED